VIATPVLIKVDPAVPVIDAPDELSEVPVVPEFVKADPDMDVIEDPDIVAPDKVTDDPVIDPPNVVTAYPKMIEEDDTETEFA